MRNEPREHPSHEEGNRAYQIRDRNSEMQYSGGSSSNEDVEDYSRIPGGKFLNIFSISL
jgi:hypothetical protein